MSLCLVQYFTEIWKSFVCFCLSDLGTSDDSSLSDSVVQDEGKTQFLEVEKLFLNSSVDESKSKTNLKESSVQKSLKFLCWIM